MFFLSISYCTVVIDDVMFIVYLVGTIMATVTTSVAVVQVYVLDFMRVVSFFSVVVTSTMMLSVSVSVPMSMSMPMKYLP